MFKNFSKMNLPNRLTFLRIILVPFFILFMALPEQLVWSKYVALAIYIIASITDALDGHIARSKNMITNFGKIMDPLADKLLVSSGFVMLTGLGVIPAFITAIILFRDFTVSSFRMFAVNKKHDVAASWSGKVKTVFQLVGICLAIFLVAYKKEYSMMFGIFFIPIKDIFSLVAILNSIMTICIVGAVITTIWSLIDYYNRFKADINVEE